MKKVTPAKKAAPAKAAPAKGSSPPSKGFKLVESAKPSRNQEIVPATQQFDLSTMLLQDAGAGLENISSADLAIPRLLLLQDLSPQANKRDEGYIEGAEAGMIMNSVTGDLYDGEAGIDVLLISYRRTHNQFWPRNSKKGKGFIADLGPDPSILDQTKKDDLNRNILPDGSEVVPTAEYFAYLLDLETGSRDQVLLSMARTQMNSAKRMNTLAQSLMVEVGGRRVLAPLFYRVYHLTARPKSNEKGSWFVWDVTPGPLVTELAYGTQLYQEASAFRQAVHAGNVKVSAPVQESDSGAGHATAEDAPM